MRTLAVVIAAALLSACSGGGGSSFAPSPAQAPPSATNAPSSATNPVQITDAMLANQSSFSDFKYHWLPTGSPSRVDTKSVVFPDDMSFHNGHVLTTAIQNDIFVNCAATCWGTPQTFQSNLNSSSFVHVIDQYTHVTTNNRYPVGTAFAVSATLFSNMVSENQIFNIVHAAAKVGGAGYGHEYHLFLPSNVDTCFDFGPCYSPDVPSSFVFCAYHGSITFSDIGHVIYSVEPFQNVSGCGDTGLVTPNGALVDGTATTLSHEFFESITDPDPGTGWTNPLISEIGDACFLFRATESLNAHSYLIQPEYSNALHGCFF